MSADKCSKMTAMRSWMRRKESGRVGEELRTALFLESGDVSAEKEQQEK